MYCQNCGSEIDQNNTVCPYCGQTNRSSNFIREKDMKIQELERKIAELEQFIKKDSRTVVKKRGANVFQPWIFIFPIVFVVLFFVLFMILVSL